MVKKTIYTDGGCAPINPDGVATYGIICFKGIVGGKKKGGIGKKKNKDNEEILWKKKGQIDHFSPSNNVAELTAILKALETVNFKKENKIFIKSDSQFAIRSILRDWDITAERIVDIHSKIEKKVKKGQEN
ncbi:MAG: RNase H family protein, partial [archaeon]